MTKKRNKLVVCFLIILFLMSTVFVSADLDDCGCDNFTDSKIERVTSSSDPPSSEDIAALQKQGELEGWTFTVGENSATQYSIDHLCGFVVPENWEDGAHFEFFTQMGGLPDYFNWYDLGGCTPIKNQGNCGSCWAFGTVGPLESAILLSGGGEVDLSEQWLVSCNSDGWGCNGGWWAHDYHQWKTDPCGDTGAVLESEFPYVAYNAPCNCPYPHDYLIDDWAFVGSEHGIPSVSAIKQAIYDHGPISVAVRADSAFQSYNGGIFNEHSSGDVNHAVVLVGWDDNQGSDGIWFLRNSWGEGWGEDGYMRIEYGCSSVGYSACYIEYGDVGDKTVEVKINKITNDPDLGDFEPIDWPLLEPEWYYRVGVESNDNTRYQYNYNRDLNGWWIFEWISEHTWNVEQVHPFHTNSFTVEVTIKLMDQDVWPNPDDLADVSAYSGGGENDDTSDKRGAIYTGTYNLKTNELTGDYVTNDGGYKVTEGAFGSDPANNAKVWFKITDDYYVPNLECYGTLTWIDVEPGGTVTDTFIVKNIGETGSKLDWKVQSWPNWGTWTFDPQSENDLPKDGTTNVQVTVVAPDDTNTEFTGEVKVVNKEDNTDYCTIPVSLTTPVNYNMQSTQQNTQSGQRSL